MSITKEERNSLQDLSAFDADQGLFYGKIRFAKCGNSAEICGEMLILKEFQGQK